MRLYDDIGSATMRFAGLNSVVLAVAVLSVTAAAQDVPAVVLVKPGSFVMGADSGALPNRPGAAF